MLLRIPVQKIAKLLIAVVLLLTLLHLASWWLHAAYGNQITELLVEKFSFDLERNFPTYFSSLILFVSSVLFFLISWAEKSNPEMQDNKFWMGLGLVFLFLSTDEAAHIHEHFNTALIWGANKSKGLLAWPWVIVYGSLVTLFTVGYFRFWLRLPATFKWSFFAAGAIYVGSALGFEMLEAREYVTNGSTYTPTYYVLTSIEELFEMSTISFLVYTNMRYLAQIFSQTAFTFTLPETHGRAQPDERYQQMESTTI